MARRKSTIPNAPLHWTFATKAASLGIYIDDELCWMGNNSGHVYALDHDAQVRRHFKLPKGVMAIVGDSLWMYAGCNNGNVYDITGQVPRLAYQIKRNDAIDWIDICDGMLAVSTSGGRVTLIDPESRVLWSHDGTDGRWTVRIDHERVYFGDDETVVAYDRFTGNELWRTECGFILFGWQTEKSMYVSTGEGRIIRLDKKTGKRKGECHVGGQGFPSCATSPDGKYQFAGAGNDQIYCFDSKGTQLWHMKTDCDTAMSMQYLKERLYIVTATGHLGCLDVSKAAIKSAEQGQAQQGKEIKAPKDSGIAVSRELETTDDPGNGVVLECVADGDDLRMHVVSKGYHKDWFVQFPRDVREEGQQYVVDEVREAKNGEFYRAVGTIRKLEKPAGRKRRGS